MISPVEVEFEGMIPASDYARKYNLHNGTVHGLAKSGRLNHMRKGVFLHVEDVPPPKTKGKSFRPGEKRCPSCKQWKALDDYSPSRRGTSGACKPCTAHHERIRTGKANSPESVSYAQELIALEQIRRMGLLAKTERNRNIRKHAARIEAMGLAGDGERWPDED